MRMIILILTLINVVFFSWAREHNFNQALPDSPVALPGYASIRLLSELERNAARPQDNAPAKVDIAQPVAFARQSVEKCFMLGPFAARAASDQAYDALFGVGIQAKQRTVKERQPKSYWVYLPPYPSLAAARQATLFLENNNVNEYYIWLDAPLKNAISLGLFANLSTARSKISALKKLGLKPEMQVRFNETTEYWLDFKRNQDDPQPAPLEEMLIKNDRLLILASACP